MSINKLQPTIVLIFTLYSYNFPAHVIDRNYSIDEFKNNSKAIKEPHSLSFEDHLKIAHKELLNMKLDKPSVKILEKIHGVELPEKPTIKDVLHTIFEKNNFDKDELYNLIHSFSTKLHPKDKKELDNLLKKYNLGDSYHKVFDPLIKKEYIAHKEKIRKEQEEKQRNKKTKELQDIKDITF